MDSALPVSRHRLANDITFEGTRFPLDEPVFLEVNAQHPLIDYERMYLSTVHRPDRGTMTGPI